MHNQSNQVNCSSFFPDFSLICRISSLMVASIPMRRALSQNYSWFMAT
jgi:hypothetical protein